MRLSATRRTAIASAGTIWTPRRNWPSAASPGLWLDPSTFADLDQDASATSPVTAVEQFAGSALDRRLAGGNVAAGNLVFTKTQGDGVLSVSGNQITVTGATTKTLINIASDMPFASGLARMQIRADYVGATGVQAWLRGVPVALTSGVARFFGFSLNNSNFERLDVSSGTVVFTLSELGYRPGNHFLQVTSTARPAVKILGGIQCLSFDGLDDGLSTGAITLGADMDCFIAVRRNAGEDSFVSAYSGSGSYFAEVGGATSNACTGSGTPTFKVNGFPVNGGSVGATAKQLMEVMPASAWHVLEGNNLNLSTWPAFKFGGYGGQYSLDGGMGGIILCPAGSDSTRAKNRRWLGSKVGLSL